MDQGNLADKLTEITEYWYPLTIADVNDAAVKVVKLKGEFVWHKHDAEDELFLVLKGSLTIHFRDHDVVLNEGDYVMIPHGVEHQPVAEDEVHLMLVEPKTTVNTGDAPPSGLTREPKRS